MKNFIKTLLFLFILGGISMTSAQAQNYSKAIGLRGGYGGGITGKMFIKDANAVEVIARFYSGVTVVTGLYEIHKDIESVDNLMYYYGGGVNASLSSYGSGFGLAGVFGLDYKFEDYPINVTFDWIPSWGFGYYSGLGYYGGGVGIRYTLDGGSL